MRTTSQLTFLGLLLCLIFPFSLRAQSPEVAFEHITVVEGLPENSAFAIVQDHLGFLWFGTQNGLVKYDGYTFEIFKPDPDDPASLSDRQVYALLEDRGGDLWVGTVRGGLNRFDRATGRFTRYQHNPEDSTSLSHNTVYSLFEDRSGVLWVATGGGLNRFDPATETFTPYRHDPNDPASLRDDLVHGIWEDEEGMFWVGTHAGGVHRFDPVSETFMAYPHDPDNPNTPSSNDVNTIYQDASGDFWIGTADGLNHFDLDTDRLTVYRYDPNDPASLSHNNVSVIHEDLEGTLWVGVAGNDVRGGLNRFDRATGRFTRYQLDPDDPNSLGGNTVLSIYEDTQGALWVGTWGGGVNKLDRATDKFTHYAHDAYDSTSLSAHQVLSIYEDRAGTLWVGTWGGGLNRFDRATGTFTHYMPNEDPSTPGSNEVMAIHADSDGFLWLGTWTGLVRFDPGTETFARYRHDPSDPNSPGGNEIMALYEDGEGMLWIGTWMNGLSRFDPAAGTFTRYMHDPADSTSLGGNQVGAIVEDDEGVLWVATGNGILNRFDRATGTFSRRTLLEGNLSIRSFAKASTGPGHYWLGTSLQGLHLYDFTTNTSEAYTEQDGLPHDAVLGVLEDDEGYVWASTARGLAKFDPRAKTFKIYDVTDGLQGNKLMYTATHKGRSGALYFGGSHGFITFHPDRLQDNPHVPPVVLTNFKLFTESVPVGKNSPLTSHISVAREIRLAYWQNDISFSFAALNYQFPEKNQYAFKLVNYDEDWRQAGTRRSATYTNLAPGEYVFRVTGSNNDDLWDEEGASIRVVITPPWWKTPWAYALFLVLGTMSLFGLVRWRVRYLERRADHLEAVVSERTAEVVQQKATIEAQARKLQELDRLKSRFFANISHEFRTPLLLILGPLQDALNGVYGTVGTTLRKQLETMQRSGIRLLRLISQLLDLSKLESGNMRLQARRRNLVPFLKGVVLSFSSMAERKKITFQMHTARDRIDVYYDQDKLEKILYNLLSNAFKFTPEHGKISIHVRCIDEHAGPVEIRVGDTGPGIAPEELPYIFDRFHQVDSSTTRRNEGTGIGLALARELVTLHGGTIEVESAVGKGAMFTVRLPLGGAHLAPADRIDDAQEGRDAEGGYRAISLGALPSISEDVPRAGETNGGLSREAPTVLLVEDHPDVRRYIKGHLAGSYHVEEAGDGIEGVEKARTVLPDLIITDVMMPGMDGYALCRALKTDPALNHIPIILLTAKAGEESKVEGLETGADDYIYKPFHADELLARAE
ncbi:MAG: two-component regulator propeller domain-containing protein [Rhodothermales bacterium]